jgi:multicomponent Na+:H+ antiporter subunit D
MSLPGLSSLLPLPVAVPLAVAALCPIAARIWRRLPLIVSLLALGASSGILLAMAPTVYGGHLLAHFMGHVLPVHGKALGIAFAADPWGLSFALVASLIGIVILVYAVSELRGLGAKEEGWFACLFLLLDAALIGSALTADVINLFVWFEVAALASYALTGFFLERPIALEASFKVLVLTNIASFAIFIGATLLYAETGGLDFGQLQQALAHHVSRPDLVALALLLGGFATKAGLLPFHGWLPDAHTAAPGSVSALFSGLMVNLGIVAIGRIVFEVFLPAGGKPVLGLLMVLGTASAVFGAVFALFQDDLKRLLAYDTISQMGVLAVGLATGSAGGIAGAAYHLWNHGLFKSLLFLCAGAILHNTGATNLSKMGGLARRFPLLAIAFSVGVLSIAGVPPFNGYTSVGLIHDALRSRSEWVPFAFMVLAQTVTIAALGKAAWMAFFRPVPKDSEDTRDEPLRPGMIIGLGVLAAGCVAFGVLYGVLLPHVMAGAAGALLHPATYARDVLRSGGPLQAGSVHFSYFDPVDLATVAFTLVAAVPLARFAMRSEADETVHRILGLMRWIQNGSVNDYTSYLVVGFLLAAGTLVIG